ncbi:hypothetical protein U9M48_030275, partial [Paspalum notatum var. saurae]
RKIKTVCVGSTCPPTLVPRSVSSRFAYLPLPSPTTPLRIAGALPSSGSSRSRLRLVAGDPSPPPPPPPPREKRSALAKPIESFLVFSRRFLLLQARRAYSAASQPVQRRRASSGVAVWGCSGGGANQAGCMPRPSNERSRPHPVSDIDASDDGNQQLLTTRPDQT